MADIKLPVRDMQFVLFDLFDYEAHCRAIPEFAETSADVVNAILEELAKFCENVLAPLNAVGDREGCQLNGHEVKTPTGFREAYQQFVAAGWPSMCNDTAFGGQGLPESLGSLMNESVGTANWAWGMYPGLSHGAMRTIAEHGTDEQRQTYLTKLVEGVWTGTMCLTEAHCGTDLGMLKTKAEPQADGSHTITGTKIFISAGEHDLSENIVHIVLARLPDAPEGTKGISLFIVPKFLPDGTRNKVFCGSLEHKMGIHGNATCVLNFDGAKGFLIGQPNRGLNAMFTFMNRARLGTAVQGLCHGEFGYQKSLAYAKDRLQMRALSGPKNPNGPADPIIVHPDVRRMLLTQKAFTEGSRMLAYFTAMQLDIEDHATDEEAKKEAADLLAFLTPIAKAFMTEFGFECANHAMQCFGGHGYIREWGVEQNVRDARIAMLYEGTTGIQALDLLGRKVLMTQGETLRRFTKLIHKFCKANAENAELKPLIDTLAQHNKEWGDLTMHIGLKAMENPEEVGAAAVDYLMYSGYVSLAYFWARAAAKAKEKLAEGAPEKSFYEAKVKTAEFYFARILPRTRTHFAAIHSGVGNLLALDTDQF
jgi:alkylation response protein AidB-like acyl-CoA dehydrogenase